MASRSTPALVYVIFGLSGIAGLGYEIIWARMFAVALGHEMPSLLAVVAAFFGGLAIGAWTLDGIISRSRVPGRWYAVLEAIIGGWALLTILLIPWLNAAAGAWIGVEPSPLRHWAISFGIPLLGLLPATVAMGATLPAMERLVARMESDGRKIGGIYATNTAGAMVGTLAGAFLLAPNLGYTNSIFVLAAINVLCAIAILAGPARGEGQRELVETTVPDRPGNVRLAVTIFSTGLLGIGYQVLGVRVMAQVLENTVYSFAAALSVYLAGTAIGAAVYQRVGRHRPFGSTLTTLVVALCTTCLLGVALLGQSGPIYESARRSFGGGQVGSLVGEFVLAGLVFLIPTALMGATFSHLAQSARDARGGIGRALGINTVGASLASPIFGVLLLPIAGARISLIIVALGYLLLIPRPAATPVPAAPAPESTKRSQGKRRKQKKGKARKTAPAPPARSPVMTRVLILAAPVLVCLTFALLADLVLIDPLPGGRIVARREGVMASVAVVDGEINATAGTPQITKTAMRVLKVNNRFRMGAGGLAFNERRQAHLPLLLHEDPRSVLFLGIGTGNTIAAGVRHPEVVATGVELVPEVLDLLPYFDDTNERVWEAPNVRWVTADARRFVRATEDRYDVIVADLFHPARDGAGMLFTTEHFAAIRDRLAPGGMFCQWVPSYQMDTEVFRMIVRTFMSVFPNTSAFIGTFNVRTAMIGLVATTDPVEYAPGWFESRVQDEGVRDASFEVGLANDQTLFGCFLAGPQDLQRFVGDGPLNTDDLPRVMFRAPRFIYGQDSGITWRPLDALIDAVAPDSEKILGTAPTSGDTSAWPMLTSYLVARNLYLQGSIREAERAPRDAIELYVRAVTANPDFSVAYSVAYKHAEAMFNAGDRQGSIDLLNRLKNANPADPRADAALRSLPPARPGGRP